MNYMFDMQKPLKIPHAEKIKLLEQISRLSKFPACKINKQKYFAFLYTNNGPSEKKTCNSIYSSIRKNKILTNKLN